MKLIDLLVQELPKRGGWPSDLGFIAQDAEGLSAGVVYGYEHEPEKRQGYWINSAASDDSGFGERLFKSSIASDSDNSFVTREQYEAALWQPVWDGEGLPPVGCEFEYGTHRTKAKCLAVGFEMLFASIGNPNEEDSEYDEFMISISDTSFHPVRTKEERHRERTLKSLLVNIAGFMATEDVTLAKNIYNAIAAGKIPGVKLDD